ncbi:MAG TPA: hypothetical protein VIM10_00360 [Actinopolymorphaceae bacterium]
MRNDRGAVIVLRGHQGGVALDTEGADIDATCLAVTPTQILRGNDERRLVPQYATQMVQLPTQIGQRLRVRRVRPEQPGDVLPALGRAGVDDQQSYQRNRARRMRPNDADLIIGNGLLTQE